MALQFGEFHKINRFLLSFWAKQLYKAKISIILPKLIRRQGVVEKSTPCLLIADSIERSIIYYSRKILYANGRFFFLYELQNHFFLITNSSVANLFQYPLGRVFGEKTFRAYLSNRILAVLKNEYTFFD